MREPAGNFFTTHEMEAIFSAEAHVRTMLAFESALARAEARAGVIPDGAAAAIEEACRVELFDVAQPFDEGAVAGTVAIPLVRELTERVAEAGRPFVHWGATSQDAIDTALVLQMRSGLDLLVGGLLDVCGGCASLAEQHHHTLMPGRTLLQQAVPVTFGLKAARWLAMSVRQVRALSRCRSEALALQLGGAVGTLAVLGDKGPDVAQIVAEELDLPLPDMPWHAERDRTATVAAALGVAAGAMAKVAGDIVLLAQTEVGEVSEEAAPGKGGSSAMPQKRNPVDATLAIASSRLALGQVPVIMSAMAQEHERAAGGWQAEWQAIPDLFCHTAGAVSHVSRAVRGLQVDMQRMLANLGQSGGLLMSEALLVALAGRVGRSQAGRLVEKSGARALVEGRTLREAALEDDEIRAALSEEAIERALDPALYLGSAGTFIDRALADYQALERSEKS